MAGSYAPIQEDRGHARHRVYRALLGLTAPWTVGSVDVDMTGQRVEVRVDAGPPMSGVRDARAGV